MPRPTPLRTLYRCLSNQAQPIPPRSQRHKVSIGIAFAAGAAVYFFLPDSSRASPTSRKIPLSPTHFTPATVLSNESSGSDSKLLELAIPTDLLPARDTFASIWSVFIKDDDIQVERPYTPLEGVDDNGRMRFWIKKYEKGEVGRWLHSKSPGDQIELRGPLQTWPWKENMWDEVVMVRLENNRMSAVFLTKLKDIWWNRNYTVLPIVPPHHLPYQHFSLY